MMGNDPAPKWAMIANGILVVLVGTLVHGMTGMGRGKRQSVGGALSEKPQQRENLAQQVAPEQPATSDSIS
jgi:hypothetical protein